VSNGLPSDEYTGFEVFSAVVSVISKSISKHQDMARPTTLTSCKELLHSMVRNQFSDAVEESAAIRQEITEEMYFIMREKLVMPFDRAVVELLEMFSDAVSALLISAKGNPTPEQKMAHRSKIIDTTAKVSRNSTEDGGVPDSLGSLISRSNKIRELGSLARPMSSANTSMAVDWTPAGKLAQFHGCTDQSFDESPDIATDQSVNVATHGWTNQSSYRSSDITADQSANGATHGWTNLRPVYQRSHPRVDQPILLQVHPERRLQS
jgi:hypothetical protein